MKTFATFSSLIALFSALYGLPFWSTTPDFNNEMTFLYRGISFFISMLLIFIATSVFEVHNKPSFYTAIIKISTILAIAATIGKLANYFSYLYI